MSSIPSSKDPEHASPDTATVEEQVWTVLRNTYDPEIPVNIVDLGLIYETIFLPIDDGKQSVTIRMTLTAPGCPVADLIKDEIEQKIAALDTVEKASVEIVFDPPWDPSRMTPAARLETGLL